LHRCAYQGLISRSYGQGLNPKARFFDTRYNIRRKERKNGTRWAKQTRQHAIKDRERETVDWQKCKREWTTSGPSNGTLE
jgi:hypothetical protein